MITWKQLFLIEKQKKYFQYLNIFLNKEYQKKTIYPLKNNIFNAFIYTPFNQIKVVIIGQDPYHDINHAHGLAFSVLPTSLKIPPSLNNIFKEIKHEFPNYHIPNNGCLIKWAQQGILLLNSILTVEAHKPTSHKNIGWEIFTNNIITYINKYCKNIIFLLWGQYALQKKKFINPKKHIILYTSHPSNYSFNKGFRECNHFITTNNILTKYNKSIIIW